MDNQEVDKAEKEVNENKYDIFIKWLQKNGAKFSLIQFPAIFEDNLVGILAKDDIPSHTAYIILPANIVISEETVKNDEFVGKIISSENKIFEEHEEGEFLRFVVFLMYHFNLGEKSFWYPYLHSISECDLLCYWTEAEKKELQDHVLSEEAANYLLALDEEYDYLTEHIFRRYKATFNGNLYTKELYYKSYTIICSRIFGWNLPSAMLIPLVDFINHHNVHSDHCFAFKSEIHEASKGSANTNLSKISFPDLGIKTGYIYKPKKSIKSEFLNEIQNEKESQIKYIWEEDYKSESDEEDNDTEEEDIEDEDKEINKKFDNYLNKKASEIEREILSKVSIFEKKQILEMEAKHKGKDNLLSLSNSNKASWAYNDPDNYLYIYPHSGQK